MTLRYLEAAKVTLPSRAPLFVEEGHCQWCGKELTGKATRYCAGKKDWDYGGYYSECAVSFLNWWCSRPAYVRATFIRDNFTCQECGLHPMREDKPWLPDISQLECDHIIPLARGGRTEMSNLQTLCAICNRKKGTKVKGGKKTPRVMPFRIPNPPPLCGEDWLREHLNDYTPEEIEALTIEIAYDSRRLPPISVADKRGKVKSVVRSLGDG